MKTWNEHYREKWLALFDAIQGEPSLDELDELTIQAWEYADEMTGN